MRSILIITIVQFFIFGCIGSDSKAPITFTTYLVEPGDIVVTNSGNKTVMLLDSDGNFKATLLDVPQAETPMRLAWKDDTKEILVTIDSTADRVIGISALNGQANDFINDIGNLNGNLNGIVVLSDGTVRIGETNNVENYTGTGIRVTTGVWPKALQTTGADLSPLANGGFIHCSSGSDVVRTYIANPAGTAHVATASSGIGGTTDAFGCIELSNGNIATVWNGTTDTVQIRSANLASVVATYSNTTALGNPRGIAQAANGNLLIVDNTANHIVEITTAGVFVRTLGEVVNNPVGILVVPDFYN